MKKFLLVAVMAIASITFAAAQPRAIGGNIGSGIGFSYQHGFGAENMLDVAVNIPLFNGIGGIVTYDWVNPGGTAIPWTEKGQWNWYAGVGGAVGMYGFHAPSWYVGVAGHIGVEYQFWFPMSLSIDWRPNLGIAGHGNSVGFNLWGLYDGFAIGIRYLF